MARKPIPTPRRYDNWLEFPGISPHMRIWAVREFPSDLHSSSADPDLGDIKCGEHLDAILTPSIGTVDSNNLPRTGGWSLGSFGLHDVPLFLHINYYLRVTSTQDFYLRSIT